MAIESEMKKTSVDDEGLVDAGNLASISMSGVRGFDVSILSHLGFPSPALCIEEINRQLRLNPRGRLRQHVGELDHSPDFAANQICPIYPRLISMSRIGGERCSWCLDLLWGNLGYLVEQGGRG